MKENETEQIQREHIETTLDTPIGQHHMTMHDTGDPSENTRIAQGIAAATDAVLEAYIHILERGHAIVLHRRTDGQMEAKVLK